MSTFIERNINVAIRLAPLAQGGGNQPPTFAGTASNTATYSGHRASVRVRNAGALSGITAHVTIWGLSLDQMNQLSTLGRTFGMIPRNVINVTAGDAVTGMSTVFIGTIMDAYADFNKSPQVPMEFECQATGAEAVISVEPSSFTGPTSVVQILQGIAKKANWTFENGLTGTVPQLSNPYLPGSAMDQIRAVRDAIRMNVDVINNVLCIWPLYGSRPTAGTPIVIGPPPVGSMIGYPIYTQQQGIMLRTVWDPRLQRGRKVQVQTSLIRASGDWVIQQMDLALDSQVIGGGQWEAICTLYRPNIVQPIVQVPLGTL